MGKRVSGNYYIPNLSKGLIDGSSKGRIDDDYKKKCSELTNFWIKNNNNIAKRPPLRPINGLESIKHVRDVIELTDRIVFIRTVDLNTEDTQEKRRALLEEIGWRPAVDTVIDGVTYNLSPDDPLGFQLYSIGTESNNYSITQFPVVSVLDFYDKETNEVILEDRYFFVQWRFTDQTETREYEFLGDTNFNFTREINRSYVHALSAIPRTSLSNVSVVTDTTARTQAEILREYTAPLSEAPTHAFIIKNGEIISSEVVHPLIRHPEYAFFINEIGVNNISFHALSSLTVLTNEDIAAERRRLVFPDELIPTESLFQSTELPSVLNKTTGNAFEVTVFGKNYVWFNGKLTTNTRFSEELFESTLNQFTIKNINPSIEGLEVLARLVPVAGTNSDTNISVGDIVDTSFVEPVTLDELIKTIPEIQQVNKFLQFSLLNFGNALTEDGVYNRLSYMLPDLQITYPGSDVPGYGRYLFEVRYNGFTYNVFAAMMPRRRWFFDNTHNDTSPLLRNEGDEVNDTNYPNGTGSGMGDYGIYLVLQRENSTDASGRPFYFPIIADFTEGGLPAADQREAQTDYIIQLTLDPLGKNVNALMQDLKLISFYSSRGIEGFNAQGMIQVGDYREDRGIEGDYDPARANPFGRFVKYATGKTGLIPWGKPNYYRRFWTYASSERPRIEEASITTHREGLSTVGTSDDPLFANRTIDGSSVNPLADSSFATPEIRRHYAALRNAITPNFLTTNQTGNNRQELARLKGIAAASKRTELFDHNLFEIHDIDSIGPGFIADIFYNGRPQWGAIGNVAYGGTAANAVKAAIRNNALLESDQAAYLTAIGTTFTAWIRSLKTRFDIDPPEGFVIDQGLQVEFNGPARRSPGARFRLKYFKVVNIEITAGPTTATPALTETFTLTRENYDSIITGVSRQLDSFRLGTAFIELYPKSTNIVNYDINTSRPSITADDRFVRLIEDRAVLSEIRRDFSNTAPIKFSEGYLDFLANIIIAGRNNDYLRRTNLGPGISLFDRTRGTNAPRVLTLRNKDKSPSSLQDYVETGRGGIILGDKRAYAISGLGAVPAARVIHETGFTGEALTDDSFIIAPAGNKIKAIRYYEEAGGYVTDIVNAELDLPSDIEQGVSLINNHKVLIFKCKDTYNAETGEDILYTLSIDNSRRVKGFTKFTIPCEVDYLVKVSEDKIGLVSTACEYSELDFNKDFNNEEGKWRDLYGGEYSTYECAFTPLPVLQVYADDFSVLKTTTLRYLVVGCNGHPAFDIQIVDGNTGQITRKTSFRRIRPDTVTIDSDFSGQVAVKNMPQNGSSQPELRISKTDDEYIEFSSINIQLGG